MALSNQRKEQPSLQEPLLTSPEAVNETIDESVDEHEQSLVIIDGLPWETSYLIKSLYFMEALGSSTWGRFGTIYYNLYGLNSQQIGLLEGLMTVVPTLALPIWGYLADSLHSRKAIYVATKAVSTVVLLMLSLPLVQKSYTKIFAVSLLVKLFVSDGLLDSYTLDLLGTVHKRLYGRYRLYASLSWGLGAVVMGYSTDHFGFEPNFVLYGLLGFSCLGLVVWKIPNEPVTTGSNQSNSENTSTVALEGAEPSQGDDSSPCLMDLVYLALRPRVFLFLLEVVAMGAGMATVERLLFLYMVNDLQASTFLCGLSVGVNVLFELPIFWHATWIMSKLGLDGMQLLSMTCFITRVYGYTLLTPHTRWCILLLEILHGITFACFWIVMTDVTKALIHETDTVHQKNYWKTTIPCVVQMLYASVGVGLGSVFGGWAMHVWGSRIMYKYMAGLIFSVCLFHLFGSILVRWRFGAGTSFLPDYTHNEEEGEVDQQMATHSHEAVHTSEYFQENDQPEELNVLLTVEKKQE